MRHFLQTTKTHVFERTEPEVDPNGLVLRVRKAGDHVVRWHRAES